MTVTVGDLQGMKEDSNEVGDLQGRQFFRDLRNVYERLAIIAVVLVPSLEPLKALVLECAR